MGSKLSQLITPPVFAATGANCTTGVSVSSFPYPPTKSKVIDIVNRWVTSCPQGGYPEVCYEDVYCRSLKYGINPAFVISIWSHESGGSNYANVSGVEDFGIHGHPDVPVANFDKQIEWFLTKIAIPGYISGCTWVGDEPEGLSKEIIMWGARYWIGNCSTQGSLAKGLQYMTEINEVYSWYTNSTITWPFTVSKNTTICDYSTSYTNTAYNSCTSKGEQLPIDPLPVGDKKWLPITGIGNDGKPISPEVDRECEDSNGCICIWKYNIKPGETTKEANQGEICTVDGKVITEPVYKVKCGNRAKTYVSTVTQWPSNSKLCEEGTPNPSSVDFPSPGQSVSWECEDGDKSISCTAKVSEMILECCLSNQDVELVEKGSCKGRVLEHVEESNCKSIDRKITIKAGVNFILASEVVNFEDVPILSAKSLMKYTEEKVILVGSFEGNNWKRIVKYDGGKISGMDFDLVPGKVYLIVATEDIEIDIKKVVTTHDSKEIDFSKLVGWNLIATQNILDKYSNQTEEILTDKELSSISQIAVWSYESSKFNYTVRDKSGEIYGESVDISNQEGIFVRGLK